MDLRIKGKVALVSGSTAGIGLAIVEALASEGAHVFLNGRTQERVDSALAQVRERLPDAQVEGIAADLGTAAGIELLVRQLGGDILINNLGIFEPKAFADITDADWLRFFEVNVLSGIRLARLYLPRMLEKNWGRIVFISSESGVQIPVEMVHYGTTKTAQIAVARGLAETVAGTGVTVNSVLPGPTRSEGVEGFIEGLAKNRGVTGAQVEEDFFKTVRPSSLLQRFATTAEVAAMVAYVASEQSSATNGAALRVDGGVVRAIL